MGRNFGKQEDPVDRTMSSADRFAFGSIMTITIVLLLLGVFVF